MCHWRDSDVHPVLREGFLESPPMLIVSPRPAFGGYLVKKELHQAAVAAALVLSSVAWSREAPDYLWRRPALSRPTEPSANSGGLLGLADLGHCYVLRASDGLLLRMFHVYAAYCDRAVPSPDGRFVALFLQRSFIPTSVTIYETSGWTEVASLGASDVAGGRQAFSPDGRFLVNPS